MDARVSGSYINRGSRGWKLGGWNEIELGPLALTRATCPPNPLNDPFAQDWTSLRKFEIKYGRLILSLATNDRTLRIRARDRNLTLESGARHKVEPEGAWFSSLFDVFQAVPRVSARRGIKTS